MAELGLVLHGDPARRDPKDAATGPSMSWSAPASSIGTPASSLQRGQRSTSSAWS